MMLTPDGPSALPLWINGHAFLTMVKQFQNVTNPATGEALRCVPLCGPDEVATACHAAESAASDWANTPQATRADYLQKLAEQLNHYANHFAKIISEETGVSTESALNEVANAASHLQTPLQTLNASASAICVVLTDGDSPLAAPLHNIAQAVVKGQCILIKTSVKSPSALYAAAELTTRIGLPAGVLNLIHGEEAAIDALAAIPEITDYRLTGSDHLAAKIQAILHSHHKHLST